MDNETLREENDQRTSNTNVEANQSLANQYIKYIEKLIQLKCCRKDLSKLVDSYKKNSDDQQSPVNKLQAAMIELQRLLNKLTDQCKIFETQQDEQHRMEFDTEIGTNYKRLLAKVTIEIQEYNNLKLRFDNVENDTNGIRDANFSQSEVTDRKLADLQQELQDISNELKQLKDEYNDYRNEVKGYHEKFIDVGNKLQELTETNSEQRMKLHQLQEVASTREEEAEKLRHAINECQIKMLAVQDNNSSVMAQIEDLITDVREGTNFSMFDAVRESKAQDELKEAQQKIREQERDIRDLHSKISQLEKEKRIIKQKYPHNLSNVLELTRCKDESKKRKEQMDQLKDERKIESKAKHHEVLSTKQKENNKKVQNKRKNVAKTKKTAKKMKK